MTPQERKKTPVFTGVLLYFKRAISELSRLSLAGNRQHHDDKPLHWDMLKSKDELDACIRHLLDAGKVDTDGQLHATKGSWRANAYLERELRYREDHNIPNTESVKYQDVIDYNGKDLQD